MTLLPSSLFGRTLLVLVMGLALTELASQVVNFLDRGSRVYRLGAQQTALRIAQSARILNRVTPAQRVALAEEMNEPDFNVMLSRTPIEVGRGFTEHDRYEQPLIALIKQFLHTDWSTSVEITSVPRTSRPKAYETADTSSLEKWIARHFYFILPGIYSVVSQVTLEDGTTAVFYARIPQEPLSRIESLLPRLLLTLGIFALLGALAVRAITRSLERLARAAERIGADPEGAPLPEHGPSEVRRCSAPFRMTCRRQLPGCASGPK